MIEKNEVAICRNSGGPSSKLQVAQAVADSICGLGGTLPWAHLVLEHAVIDRPRLSWYYTATTVTSIGYGDITPQNADERLLSITVPALCFLSIQRTMKV